MLPRISDLSTWPWAPASRSTLSITSRNTSFLRYLIPSYFIQRTIGAREILVSGVFPECVFLLPSGSLQETALVTAGGGLGAPTSSLYPSWVMYSWIARHYQLLALLFLESFSIFYSHSKVLSMSPLWTDLQYLGICGLRISKVHHLVQKLVTDHKVVPDMRVFH